MATWSPRNCAPSALLQLAVRLQTQTGPSPGAVYNSEHGPDGLRKGQIPKSPGSFTCPQPSPSTCTKVCACWSSLPPAPLPQPPYNNPSLLSHWVFAEHSAAIVVSFSSYLQSALQLLLGVFAPHWAMLTHFPGLGSHCLPSGWTSSPDAWCWVVGLSPVRDMPLPHSCPLGSSSQRPS